MGIQSLGHRKAILREISKLVNKPHQITPNKATTTENANNNESENNNTTTTTSANLSDDTTSATASEINSNIEKVIEDESNALALLLEDIPLPSASAAPPIEDPGWSILINF